MRSWTFPLAIDPRSDTPLFVQIARAIADDIARGRLRKGDPLPGTRTLAQTLGVHRTTVVAAYAELGAQGWTGARPGGATFVATSSPDGRPRRFAPRATLRAHVPQQPGFAIDPPRFALGPNPPMLRGALRLWGGVPDLRLVPVDLLARAYRRAARVHGRTLLGYSGDGRGHPRLREALADMISRARGLAAGADSLMVTRGSQMALDLVARSLVAPGDVVAIEALGYRPAFQVFTRAGARLVPISVDREGLDVGELAARMSRTPVRLLYLTPHHQYPTTVMLSPARRLLLLELAERARMAIVEDDYDQEFHYDGRPVLPLASADSRGVVIYVGTLAKILAPGLRLGFAVAPQPVVARMAAERELIDRQGDAVLECAVAELLEDGDLVRHVRRMRRVYHARRDAMCEAVEKHLAAALSFHRPAGGLALWANVAADIDVDRWQERAAEKGVYFQTGRHFTFDGSPAPNARLGYGMVDEREIALAVRRLAQCIPG
jgi:GntR family transcriptional regulator/MocR family aminotransferase